MSKKTMEIMVELTRFLSLAESRLGLQNMLELLSYIKSNPIYCHIIAGNLTYVITLTRDTVIVTASPQYVLRGTDLSYLFIAFTL